MSQQCNMVQTNHIPSVSSEQLPLSLTSPTPLPPLPPPPPPPPSLPDSSQIVSNMFLTNNNNRFITLIEPIETNPSKLVEDACEFFWNVLYPTTLDNDHDLISVVSLYNDCEAIIQSGPTCGLVALIMGLKLVNPQINVDLEMVLNKAQFRGYSKFGEMFSVHDMSKFIEIDYSIRTSIGHCLKESILDIVQHLCNGLPVLVPYDADANYEPCLKDGNRAHWATICGCCIVANLDTALIPEDLYKASKSINNKTLIQIDNKLPEQVFNFLKPFLLIEKLFVYARQGKSRRIQIWNFEQLCQSNQNLNKVSNKILNDPDRVEMIYPKDGNLTTSLANQFLFLYK